MKADVEGVAKEIVDEIAEQGEGRLRHRGGRPAAARIILDMMGIPAARSSSCSTSLNVILGFTDPEYVDDIEDPMGVTMAILTAGQGWPSLSPS